MPWTGLALLLALIECCILLLSGYIILRFHESFCASILTAPSLLPLSNKASSLPSIAVIIPAYNEAVNLADCTMSVLQSDLPDPQQLRVYIADDESTDATGAIAQALAAQDARVQVIAVPPRPVQEKWMGKNWACTQAAAQAQADYLLFLDADVRLKPAAIATALATAQAHQVDLLSGMPQIVCGCLSEWLVQPLMWRLLISGFNVKAVNDPAQPDVAFAAGPFMLFRRAAYVQIGGHRGVADDLVEDVALARRIKAAGLTMRLSLGLDVMEVRMYRSFAALWEGWTKNMHLGAQRRLSSTLTVALIAACVLTVPWLGVGVGILNLWLSPIASFWSLGIVVFSVAILLLESILWRRQAQLVQQPVRYWGLSWLGGLLVAAIAIASIIKTETGWGWTWRGRSLSLPSHAKADP